MMLLTKNPKPKNFFSLQTRRLAECFERLNDSLMQWFPTFLGLRHPTKHKYNFQHLVANP